MTWPFKSNKNGSTKDAAIPVLMLDHYMCFVSKMVNYTSHANVRGNNLPALSAILALGVAANHRVIAGVHQGIYVS